MSKKHNLTFSPLIFPFFTYLCVANALFRYLSVFDYDYF